MADYAGASKALLEAITKHATTLGGISAQTAAPSLLQLAQAYAAVRGADNA